MSLNSEHVVHITKGDRGIPCLAKLVDANGDAIDISGDTAKTFVMVNAADGAKKVDYQACTFVTDGTDGQLRYDFIAADVDTAGEYYAHFRREITSGIYSHHPPEQEMLKIVIHDPVA